MCNARILILKRRKWVCMRSSCSKFSEQHANNRDGVTGSQWFTFKSIKHLDMVLHKKRSPSCARCRQRCYFPRVLVRYDVKRGNLIWKTATLDVGFRLDRMSRSMRCRPLFYGCCEWAMIAQCWSLTLSVHWRYWPPRYATRGLIQYFIRRTELWPTAHVQLRMVVTKSSAVSQRVTRILRVNKEGNKFSGSIRLKHK